jgi:hypothetical protein
MTPWVILEYPSLPVYESSYFLIVVHFGAVSPAVSNTRMILRTVPSLTPSLSAIVGMVYFAVEAV